MDYALFLLVNAILFLRPAEIFPDLAEVPIYERVIIACLVFSLPRVIAQLSLKSLGARPITFGVLLLWPVCALAHIVHQELELAGESLLVYFKIVVYYLLLVGVINTPARLRGFLFALGVFITILTAVAVLRYYEVIEITPPPNLVKADERDKKDDGTAATVEDRYFDNATGEVKIVKRLRGTGIFNDPNDLCLALVSGILIGAFTLSRTSLGAVRFLSVFPMGLFLFALKLTQSRGGLLGLLAGLAVLFTCRYGWRRALLTGAVAVPILLLLFGGRMTDFSDAASEGTGQTRLQLWRDGMVLFKESPAFGVGMNEYSKHARQVAHNSFVHSFTELGIVGGMVFLGMFFCAIGGLKKAHDAGVLDDELKQMFPFVLALVAAYTVGILSLSRNYEVPTYTVLGLATAYLNLVKVDSPQVKLHCTASLLQSVVLLSLAFLLVTDLVVRFFAV